MKGPYCILRGRKHDDYSLTIWILYTRQHDHYCRYEEAEGTSILMSSGSKTLIYGTRHQKGHLL